MQTAEFLALPLGSSLKFAVLDETKDRRGQ